MIWPDDFINKVICGDAIWVMEQIPDSVIQCCVTSPPYWGLRDYGISGQIGLESTPEEYIAKMVKVFREVRRVLKEDGTLWLNIGDSYANATRTTDKAYDSFGDNTQKLGERITNRKTVKGHPVLKDKDLCMIPARVALALQADGWYLRSVIIWHKPSCMPESVTDRPTTAHEYVYLLCKSESYYYDADAIREPHTSIPEGLVIDPTSWKESYTDQVPGRLDHRNAPLASRPRNYYGNIKGRNKRTVWTINPEPTPYAHFATFPQKLVEPCIMAGTSEKGNCGKCGKPWVRVVDYESQYDKREPCHQPGNTPTKVDSTGWRPPKRNSKGWQASCDCGVEPVPAIVIDPFSGSGTVGVVAKRLQRKYVLIDLSTEYCKIAEDRLRQRELAL